MDQQLWSQSKKNGSQGAAAGHWEKCGRIIQRRLLGKPGESSKNQELQRGKEGKSSKKLQFLTRRRCETCQKKMLYHQKKWIGGPGSEKISWNNPWPNAKRGNLYLTQAAARDVALSWPNESRKGRGERRRKERMLRKERQIFSHSVKNGRIPAKRDRGPGARTHRKESSRHSARSYMA